MENEGGNAKCLRNRGELFSVMALLAAMFMAVGPGVLLINRPETVLGLPLVYMWGILWYFLICGIAIVTDHYIWSKEMPSDEDHNGIR